MTELELEVETTRAAAVNIDPHHGAYIGPHASSTVQAIFVKACEEARSTVGGPLCGLEEAKQAALINAACGCVLTATDRLGYQFQAVATQDSGHANEQLISHLEQRALLEEAALAQPVEVNRAIAEVDIGDMLTEISEAPLTNSESTSLAPTCEDVPDKQPSVSSQIEGACDGSIQTEPIPSDLSVELSPDVCSPPEEAEESKSVGEPKDLQPATLPIETRLGENLIQSESQSFDVKPTDELMPGEEFGGSVVVPKQQQPPTPEPLRNQVAESIAVPAPATPVEEEVVVTFPTQAEEVAAVHEAQSAVAAGEPESSADEDEVENVTAVGTVVEAIADYKAIKIADNDDDPDVCDDMDLYQGSFYRVLEDIDEEGFYFGKAETGPNVGTEGYISSKFVRSRPSVTIDDISRINADNSLESQLELSRPKKADTANENNESWRHFVDEDVEELSTSLTLSGTSDRIEQLAAVANSVIGGNVTDKKHFEKVIQQALDGDDALSVLNLSNTQRIFQSMCESERDATLEQIATAVRTTVCLESLEMSNVGLTDTFVIKLADALKENDSISKVVLDTNDIRGAGYSAIAEMLLVNRSIRRFCATNQQTAVPTAVQHELVESVRANGLITTCNIDFHDATARDTVGKALMENADNIRKARLAAREANENPHSGSDSMNRMDSVGKKPKALEKPKQIVVAGVGKAATGVAKAATGVGKAATGVGKAATNVGKGVAGVGKGVGKAAAGVGGNVGKAARGVATKFATKIRRGRGKAQDDVDENELYENDDVQADICEGGHASPSPVSSPEPSADFTSGAPVSAERAKKAQSQLEALREKKRLRDQQKKQDSSAQHTPTSTESSPTHPRDQQQETPDSESEKTRRPSTKERLALWQKKLADDGEANVNDVSQEVKGKRPGKPAFGSREGDKCVHCQARVYLNEKVSVDGIVYHKHCFRCSVPECKKLLTPGTYAAMTGTMYCKPCFKRMFKLKGNYDEV